MRNWDDFYGCEKLSIDENISFLLYLENSNRIKTKEGKFLHYQYLRYLLKRQGCLVKNYLPPEHGSFYYYTISNLQIEIDKIKKSHGWSRMLIPTYRRYIDIINNIYTEEWYSTTKITDAYNSIKPLKYSKFSDVIESAVDNYYNMLLINYEIINKRFDDAYIKKNGKVKYLSVKELFSGWYNNKYRIDNTYLYQMEVKPLLMNFKWVGYSNYYRKITKGISKIDSMEWLNI